MAVEHHRGLEVGVVVTRGPGPGDETKHEEEDRREERDDDRLLATLALPPRHALTLRETWKRDTTCHGKPKCTARRRAGRPQACRRPRGPMRMRRPVDALSRAARAAARDPRDR